MCKTRHMYWRSINTPKVFENKKNTNVKLAKLGDAIAISNLKLSITD